MEDVLDSTLDLVRRLPPKDLKKNLSHLLKIRPEISEDLLQTVDQPLEVAVCPVTQKEYLLCDYNRDEDSYRSPHSNEFDPPLPGGSKPSDRLRNLEVIANEVFEVYAKQYYGEALSSCYFWDLEDTVFACCILIKKNAQSGSRGVESGGWDSIHIVEVDESESRTDPTYKITSSILLSLTTAAEGGEQTMSLCGSIADQREKRMKKSAKKDEEHVVNIGKFVEDMENRLRNTIDQVYFGKTTEVLASVHDRSASMRSGHGGARQKNAFAADLASVLRRRGGAKE
uniref:F-actin-capping protein subunit beta n=1 Tax=Stygiella incarcerata TaxID=1712417 RepID=A0A192ZHU7_9EUKA|nr:F-actin-capping protein subunit beta [Stygiella incarcerata]|eukprot:TRINITY_DN82215_c0_g1_i1.p1 TRINITY_DN82215_c0_g1~~TRINITY_DN82215_c0_g1_i1.p1  ORF type:complete len:285 (-),score=77.15 TRINITY_DN82215_c0_g1_i1:288-1142(-)